MAMATALASIGPYLSASPRAPPTEWKYLSHSPLPTGSESRMPLTMLPSTRCDLSEGSDVDDVKGARPRCDVRRLARVGMSGPGLLKRGAVPA